MTMRERTSRVRKGRETKTPKSTIGVVQLAPFEGGILLPEALDAASTLSCHLGAEVSRCMPTIRGMATPREALILVAEADQDKRFCVDDLDELLRRFSEDPTALGESGMHHGTASLFLWEKLEPSEWEERRRRALTRSVSPYTISEMAPEAKSEPARRQTLDQLRNALDQLKVQAQADADLRRESTELLEGALGELRMPPVEGWPPIEKVEQPASKPTPKQASMPPRTGHDIIIELAKLFDDWDGTLRPQAVRRFQKLLDSFHETQSLGSYEDNRNACKWINTIARTKHLKLMLNINTSEYTAVTIECVNQSQSGYFVPRLAQRPPKKVKGHLAPKFPKLSVIAL